jgi:hypothetical protein
MDAGDRAGLVRGAALAAEPGVTEAGEGHGVEEAERSLRRALEPESKIYFFYLGGRVEDIFLFGRVASDGRPHHNISDIESILNS